MYNKFGSEQIGKCRDVIRDIIENEFEQSMFDDYIDCSEFPSKEIMLYVASAIEADDQKEKAKWLRTKVQERPDEKELEVKFYWLNNRVETEFKQCRNCNEFI